jgi:hypothetical protein
MFSILEYFGHPNVSKFINSTPNMVLKNFVFSEPFEKNFESVNELMIFLKYVYFTEPKFIGIL